MGSCISDFDKVHTILLFLVQRRRSIFLCRQVDTLDNLQSLLLHSNLLNLSHAIVAAPKRYIPHLHLGLVYPIILPQIGEIDGSDPPVVYRDGTLDQYRTTL